MFLVESVLSHTDIVWAQDSHRGEIQIFLELPKGFGKIVETKFTLAGKNLQYKNECVTKKIFLFQM